MRPPFRAGSFDFVLASLFLHHFATAQAAEMIASYSRIARVAVIINDPSSTLDPVLLDQGA
jgi:hypothetical protein